MPPLDDFTRKQYSSNHWAKIEDPEKALSQYLVVHNTPFNTNKDLIHERVIGNVQGLNCLDYGCGGGFISIKLAQQGAQVTGVDIELSATKMAAYYATKNGVQQNCNFFTLEQFSKVAVDNFYDVIIAKDIIEHIENDDGFIFELSRLVKRGGRVLFTTQNKASLNYLLEGGYRKYRGGEKNWLGWDETHVRWYTPWSLVNKIQKYGLQPASLHAVYLVPYNILFYLTLGKVKTKSYGLQTLDHLLGKRFPFKFFGFDFILESVKS